MNSAATLRPQLSASGILRSEWVKLFTLRSTWWCLSIFVAFAAGAPLLLALSSASRPYTGGSPSPFWISITTATIDVAVLISATLGALVITGEYGTGMIRSSMVATPKRLSTLWAKQLVIGAVTLIITFLALVAAALGTGTILAANQYPIDFADSSVWLTLLIASLYPALIAVFAVGLGAMLRNSTGTITSIMGLLLVLPPIVQLAGYLLNSRFLTTATMFLPSNLGATMRTPLGQSGSEGMTTDAGITLDPAQATGVLLCWVLLAVVGGASAMRRRDV